ncbi:arginine--tRNA ligase [Halocatena marina]|uniref:arginine--tRNA ligase n=1 Tax=Halocatena marina TaxID=2934937 RepID=UPI002010BA91|nr:arginine--tRNA ligase [Halocatena marina]
MLQVLRDRLTEDMTAILTQWDCEGVIGSNLIEINEYEEGNGDRAGEKGLLATPIAYQLASERERSPADIAVELADAFRNREEISGIESIEAVDGYVNFYVDEDELTTRTLERILESESAYGQVADSKAAFFEFSSPNIAKPLHIGHLRNTILGDVLGTILETRGYDLVRDNHIGDWGVQFGHLLSEYEKAIENGEDVAERFDADPIDCLLELYQRYGRHEAELENAGREEDLERVRERGRKYFARLEAGEKPLRERWERFHAASCDRFESIYDRLGVTFDTWHGESFYVTEAWTNRLRVQAYERDVAVETANGAYVIPIYDGDCTNVTDPERADVCTDTPDEISSEEDDPEYEAFVLLKRDGTTTYGMRDLATIAYRTEQYDELFYVVGSEQRDYFQQLFAAARKFGYTDARFTHVDYGLIDLPDGSMSTREGRLITAKEVLDQVHDRAFNVVRENNPSLDETTASKIAEGVTLGTVRFENIAKRRTKNTTFDIEQATALDGDTGPYVQYAATRGVNILRKADSDVPDSSDVTTQPLNEYDHQLAVQLARYPLVLQRCEERYDPAPLAQYLLDLAKSFNKFYHENRVLDAAKARERRLILVAATVHVFESAFEITGIPMLEQM